jgi:hypothetical protein
MTTEVKRLWMAGLPPKLRGSLWSARIGDELHITQELFATFQARAR